MTPQLASRLTFVYSIETDCVRAECDNLHLPWADVDSQRVRPAKDSLVRRSRYTVETPGCCTAASRDDRTNVARAKKAIRSCPNSHKYSRFHHFGSERAYL